MYQRYMPRQGGSPPKQGKPTAGEMNRVSQNLSVNAKTPARSSLQQGGRQNMARMVRETEKNHRMPEEKREIRGCGEKKTALDSILGLLPSSLYHPQTKKILGLISAEDLLLIAMILLVWESDQREDSVLAYLLLYILISDYIDLPFEI